MISCFAVLNQEPGQRPNYGRQNLALLLSVKLRRVVGKVSELYFSKSSSLPIHVYISDTLLYFGNIQSTSNVAGATIEAKFRTF